MQIETGDYRLLEVSFFSPVLWECRYFLLFCQLIVAVIVEIIDVLFFRTRSGRY